MKHEFLIVCNISISLGDARLAKFGDHQCFFQGAAGASIHFSDGGGGGGGQE